MITTPQEYGYRIQLLNMAHAAHAACNCNWATKSSAVMPRASWRFSCHQVASSAQKAARNTQNYHELLTELPTKPHTCLSFHHPKMDDLADQDVVIYVQRWVPSCWRFLGPWNPHVFHAEIPISVKRSCRNCCSSSFCDSAISVWHQGVWFKGEADGNPNLLCSLRVS